METVILNGIINIGKIFFKKKKRKKMKKKMVNGMDPKFRKMLSYQGAPDVRINGFRFMYWVNMVLSSPYNLGYERNKD